MMKFFAVRRAKRQFILDFTDAMVRRSSPAIAQYAQEIAPSYFRNGGKDGVAADVLCEAEMRSWACQGTARPLLHKLR